MRFHAIVLLAVAILFLLTVDAASVAANSAKILLRTGTTDDGDDEGRVITIHAGGNLPGLIKTKVSDAKMKAKLVDLFLRGKSADDVLTLLKLDDGVGNLLSNPKLQSLSRYISNLNLKNRKSKVTMVETLKTRYGDASVAKMLEVGKKSKSTENMAKTLQDEQFQIWRRKKQSPLDVFKLLKLDDFMTSPVGRHTLKAWVGYITKLRRDEETTMLKTFRAVYGDRDLASLLYGSKLVPETKDAATKLENHLFFYWRYIEMVEPNDVFVKIFKLQPGTVATNAEMNIVGEYVRYCNTSPVGFKQFQNARLFHPSMRSLLPIPALLIPKLLALPLFPGQKQLC